MKDTIVSAAILLAGVCGIMAEGAYPIHHSRHWFDSFDGTKIDVDAWSSTPLVPGEKFPVVIFPSSWAWPVFEYTQPQKHLASKGYITIAYSTRGFYGSGGEITVAGPNDVADTTAVIDFALKTFPNADKDQIAFVGMSYGGGIALLAAANNTDVKSVVSLSGWMNVRESVYWNDSPGIMWAKLLSVLASFTGRLDPMFEERIDDLTQHRDMAASLEWLTVRGVEPLTKYLEARQVPVFVNNNMEDHLFHANNVLDWWMKYKGPKKLTLSQGTHAEAEIPELVLPALPSPIWKDTFDFLDYTLKGADNGVMTTAPVQMQLQTGLVDKYLVFESWPPVVGFTERTYKFEGRGERGRFGSLVPASAHESSGRDTIGWSRDTKMVMGIPIVTAALEPFIPFRLNLDTTHTDLELLFHSEPMSQTTRVCGTIKLTDLTVIASEDRFQVYGYVYDLPPKMLGVATKSAVLMGHTARTVWDDAPKNVPFTLGPMEFRVTCYDVKKNHRLVIGFNLHNNFYGAASTNTSVTFTYDTATVTFPILDIP